MNTERLKQRTERLLRIIQIQGPAILMFREAQLIVQAALEIYPDGAGELLKGRAIGPPDLEEYQKRLLRDLESARSDACLKCSRTLTPFPPVNQEWWEKQYGGQPPKFLPCATCDVYEGCTNYYCVINSEKHQAFRRRGGAIRHHDRLSAPAGAMLQRGPRGDHFWVESWWEWAPAES